ncbi:MAG: hypothetical protein KKB51_08930 [Candidatus Riflebacteria bacterium]|nr:hypothetical protein [Candidatus Riflebacteria bacterium]
MKSNAEIVRTNPFIARKGSAFLVAVGVLSVLVLMIIFFSKTRTARRWSTRLMSNESKAEAVAEAAVNVGLRMISDQMNKAGDEWYKNLRVSGKLSNNGNELSDGDGFDIPMTLPDTKKNLGTIISGAGPSGNEYLDSLQSMMQDNGSWTVILSAKIASAAAMSALNDDGPYHVTGINKEPVKPLAIGDVCTIGQFIEKISANPGSNVSFSTLMSNYRLNLMLPPNHAQSKTTDSFTVEKKILWFKIKIKGSMTLTLVDRVGVPFTGSATQATDYIGISGYVDLVIMRIDFPLPGQDPIEVKIYKDVLAPILETAKPYLTEFSVHQLLTKITGSADWMSYYWSDAKCLAYLQAAWNSVNNASQFPNGWQGDLAVEKTGAVQITAEVFYEPQEDRLIKRTLTAERPFKISDMQPVAPEYVFFVNNSNDKEIKFIGTDPGSLTASSAIHPIPREDSKQLDFKILESAFGGVATNDKTQIPGMIRINGTKKMAVALFTGALTEAHTTHYNALMNDESSRIQLDPNNKIDPRFNWLNKNNPLPMETVYIPLEPTLPTQPTERFQEEGLVNMWDILKESKLGLMAPTCLFGDYMLEYPLNLQLEGYLVQRYSKLSLEAKVNLDGDKLMDMMDAPPMPDPPPAAIDTPIDPNNPPADVAAALASTTVDFDVESLRDVDKSEIRIFHQRMEEPYGVRISRTKATNSMFAPSNPRTLPPALYSDLQYAKKAKYYYETSAEFLKDFEARGYELDGVNFINESIALPEMTVEGTGLIVSRLNVNVNGNISRKDGNTVFGLIARNGAIMVKKGVSRIEAACYSHKTLMNTAFNPLVIDGNLVMDELERNDFNSVSVIYNGPACRTTFLSIVRDVGKYDPARYHAVLGKQWSRYEYEKR